LDRKAAALRAIDLREQWLVIEKVYARLDQRRSVASDAPASVEALAYQLHNLCGACEQLFELVARAFENQIDARRYHVDPLRRMKSEIDGVRPALLSEAPLAADLHDLRGFRHFFRHAYGTELKPEQVRALTVVADRIRGPLKSALHEFVSAIGGEAQS
jgi:hypothetical protein